MQFWVVSLELVSSFLKKPSVSVPLVILYDLSFLHLILEPKHLGLYAYSIVFSCLPEADFLECL